MADAWQSADPAATAAGAGSSDSVKTDSSTSKALADAQKQLRISQQQVNIHGMCLFNAVSAHLALPHMCSRSADLSYLQHVLLPC